MVNPKIKRKIKKEEITIRNLLKELIVNSSCNYPTEKSLIIHTEKLYDLKLLSSTYRVGNYSILSFKTRFLNEAVVLEKDYKNTVYFNTDNNKDIKNLFQKERSTDRIILKLSLLSGETILKDDTLIILDNFSKIFFRYLL